MFDDEIDNSDLAEGLAVRTQARRLRARASLHPMDPDALSEEEMELLEELEEWEP